MPHQNLCNRERATPLIERLGGPEQAARKLGLFLRMPGWAGGADDSLQWAAVILLAYSGDPGLPVLGTLLDRPNPDTQVMAALGMAVYCLNGKWPDCRESSVHTLPMPWSATEQELSFLLGGELSGALELGAKHADPRIRNRTVKDMKTLKVTGPDDTPYRPY